MPKFLAPPPHPIASSHIKSTNFHETFVTTLNKHFKENTVNMTSLDKPWCTLAKKLKHSEMQKELFKRGKTKRWKKFKIRIQKSKKEIYETLLQRFC